MEELIPQALELMALEVIACSSGDLMDMRSILLVRQQCGSVIQGPSAKEERGLEVDNDSAVDLRCIYERLLGGRTRY
jgi:hypothetical protein